MKALAAAMFFLAVAFASLAVRDEESRFFVSATLFFVSGVCFLNASKGPA